MSSLGGPELDSLTDFVKYIYMSNTHICQKLIELGFIQRKEITLRIGRKDFTVTFRPRNRRMHTNSMVFDEIRRRIDHES
jgi:predicted transcriptional regulator